MPTSGSPCIREDDSNAEPLDHFAVERPALAVESTATMRMKAKQKRVPRKKAPRAKLSLPSPHELERICKGIATLDAMLMEEWQDRYYSFDHAWSKKAKRRMASMRNGSGDEWFLVFEPAGVFFKAFWHEYPPNEDVTTLYAGLPTSLQPQLKEPAFSMGDVTFGGWHDGTKWTLRGNATGPMQEQLEILGGDPEKYRAYAASYFEVDVPSDAIAHVLAGKKLDARLVKRITTERSLADLKSDLAEIGY